MTNYVDNLQNETHFTKYDVDEAIAEIEAEIEGIEVALIDLDYDISIDNSAFQPEVDDLLSDKQELLAQCVTLLKFNEEAGWASSDWSYGSIAVADEEFEDYAQDLAYDIGAVDRDANWPNAYIDWTAAAEALKIDYTPVDLDGDTYLVR